MTEIEEALKGKVLEACVYGLETLALTENQEKRQVAENSCIGRIGKKRNTKTKREDGRIIRRDMNEKHLRTRFVGHVQIMSEEILTNRVWKTEEGDRRRGGPKLKQMDNIKRYRKGRREQPRVGENGRRSR